MYKAIKVQNKRSTADVNGSSIHPCHKSVVLAIVLFSTSLCSAVAEESLLQAMEREFQAIVKSVQPSVVEVVATCSLTAQKISSERQRVSLADEAAAVFYYQNIGSGIIINSAGHIVTTAAVVDKADKIEVVFANGQCTSGTLLGVDTLTDIALLSVESDTRPQPRIGDSAQVDTGAWVITVGSSYGHSSTFSFGTVSGLEVLPDRPFYDAIKLNASVNPGNSGGAVVNTSGEIVGLIAATLVEPYLKQVSPLHPTMPQRPVWMRSEVGFAIPINTVKQIADQLTQYGKVPRGWLGVRLEQRATAVGVRVTEVLEDSPAQKAGIKPQDVIVEFKGKPVHTFLELKKRVASCPPDTRAVIKIRRDGKLLQREAVLGERE